MELAFRFIIGGFVVSLFAVLGDVLKPKSFAGLFGAAPSVALATLGLTLAVHGKIYAATEARSMIAGAGALFLYSSVSSRLMMRYRWHALFTAFVCIGFWLVISFGIWLALLR